MRKLFMLAAMACLVFSCETPESERMPELMEMKLSDENPTALESSVTVQVRCDLHWTVELEDNAWGSVKVDQVVEGSGGSCTLTLDVNQAEDARENVLVLKAGKGELRKTIRQGGLGTFFQPRSVQLTGTQEASVAFPSPSAWTASADASWVQVKTPSGTAGSALLKLQAQDANENVGSREGTVRVTIGSHTFSIPVLQGQTDVILSDDTDVSFDYKGGEFTVTTRSNVEYKIEVSDNWVTHVGTKAPLNQNTETFSVAQNESPEARTATISFSGADAGTLLITVSQEGKDPILNVTEQGFYGIEGVNYVLHTDGWNQSALHTSTEWELRHRLFKQETLSVAEVTGLSVSAEEGDIVNLHFLLKSKFETQLSLDYQAQVLLIQNYLVWLKVSETTYFVLPL